MYKHYKIAGIIFDKIGMESLLVRNLFVCNRPFQLFNILNYIQNGMNNHEHCYNDLYLLDIPVFRSWEKSIEELKVFDKIFFYQLIASKTESKMRRMCKQGFVYLFPQLFFKLYVFPENSAFSYNRIFASAYDDCVICAYEFFKNAEFVLMEDGIGTYNSNIRKHSRLLNRLFHFFTTKGSLSVCADKLYVYKPNLLQEYLAPSVFQLPVPTYTVLNSLKKVSGYKYDSIYENALVCYLDEPNPNIDIREDIFKTIHEIVANKFVIRMHPMQLNVPKTFFGEIVDKKEIWEILASDFPERLILISIYSSAMYTPYFIYNKMNPCIFLYKVVPVSVSRPRLKEIDSFVHRIANEREGIYVPENLNEYKTILHDLVGMNDS